MAAPKTAVFRRKVGQRVPTERAPSRKASGQMRDPVSGKKVFGREFRSGNEAGKAGAKGPAFARTVSSMQTRLGRMDAGKLKGKPGERSFMRGFLASPAALALTRKAASPDKARSSGS